MTQCETCPYTKNTTTHTCNFTRESFPIKEELSCFTENTIYSLTCLKGSGTFTKKPGKKAKECPPDGTLQLHGEDKAVNQKDGSSKLMKCSKEAVYIGKTCQHFRERIGQHKGDLGKARDCSTKSFVIYQLIQRVIHPFPPTALRCRDAQMVRDSSYSCKIDYVQMVFNSQNPKENLNFITGSKVMALLLNGLILPVGEVASVKGVHAACVAGLFHKGSVALLTE